MKDISRQTVVRSLSVAMAMFLASAPILLVIPSLMTKVGFEATLVFWTIAFSCALSTLIATYYCRLPLLFGPGIAGASYLAIHVGARLGLPLPMIVTAAFLSTVLYFLAWLANGPSRMLEVLGPHLSRAIGAMLGVFLIRLTIESTFMEFGSTFDRLYLAKLALLLGIPVVVIEWGQRQSWSISYLLGMLVCYGMGQWLGLEAEGAAPLASQVGQESWPTLSQLIDMIKTSKGFFSACFGLWLIQTIDVAGCTAAMVELAKERKWLHRPIVSNRKIQIFAPLGNLMGFALGPFGFSAPHCLHLSSALALCTPAPLYPKLIAGCIAAFFLASAALSQWVQNLPFYLASPVILWVGIAMIKPLPWNVRKGGLEVIAGLVMTMSVAYTHDIALSMALGFWLALAIRFFEKKKIELASWVLALGFIAYTYLVAA